MKYIKTKDFKITKQQEQAFKIAQKKYNEKYFFMCLGCNRKFNNLGMDYIQTQYCSLICKMENFDNNEKLLKTNLKLWKKKLCIKSLNEKNWNLKS